MTRKILILCLGLLMTLCMLSGCSTAEIFQSKTDEALFNDINDLYEQIDKEEWDGALSNVNKFQKNYEKQKLKLLMLGTIDYYHELELEVESLKEYVKDEDDVESKLGLNEIKYRLFTIYNL
ncbi:DUF4363 family protein [Salipaludibacillus sp. CF4.18]|uniref:DUF4363 family protein n=1 Tax=Salipaludibacillus sp. CF4.18 TaxID=3373081 RepID=UPI003EE678C7